ncbi:hypothetical protein IAI10_23905 [Clostridium sp. 19966]|uniref:hypothetical protein n=1 Tax=Clostridium sp. 19966 TaxID=2768166 RepID=UPI0028DF46C0|nr:hypothetical protein [Clostridium sp. 19966]MDT8719684.1 hypothetical protein [Clostridium sp. 19966]
MKKLGLDIFEKVVQSINRYARPLEKSIFQYRFFGGTENEIVNELKKYQNKDGGFGHGIESDFRLTHSSPMATSIGIRLLSEIDSLKEAKEMISAAIGYLETTYDINRNGLFAVPKELNDFPHAPWWHYNEDDGMTVIDKNWGNPSAEIVAYLYRYKEYVKSLDIEKLVEYAINYIESKEEISSENEIFCYIKLYEVLTEHLQMRLERVISSAVEHVIVYDTKEWHEYVPTPVDFVSSINSSRFGVLESKIDENLDFLINQLQSDGKINPPWGDSYYKGDLKEAYNEWIGVLSLKALVTLNGFKRIEL